MSFVLHVNSNISELQKASELEDTTPDFLNLDQMIEKN